MAPEHIISALFHDWTPDHICQQILCNTVSAMASGYSWVLIIDFVLPDIVMTLPLLSFEWSKRQWRDLLHSVGLGITGIWNHSPGMESVIEAVPMPLSGQKPNNHLPIWSECLGRKSKDT